MDKALVQKVLKWVAGTADRLLDDGWPISRLDDKDESKRGVEGQNVRAGRKLGFCRIDVVNNGV